MTKEKLDYFDLQYRLDAEGQGYAITGYYGREINCGDAYLENLWAECYDKLTELKEYVDDKCNESPQD